MKDFIITIARGFGSGGKEIASKVAKDLGIHCYENRILTLASELSGINKEEFEEANEKLRENKRSFIETLPLLQHRIKPYCENKNFVSNDELYKYEKKIILELANTESCVIVGKCADWILKDNPRTFSIYIEAPREFCRPRIMKKMNVNKETADASISKTDEYRAAYYKYYTSGNYWTNPVNYDLTINSARWGIEASIELIKKSLLLKFPDLNTDF
jgi:cytidylate kinase